MKVTLITLDLSYNNITELPKEIGELILLKELRCSFNKILVIPPEIARIKRLRKLFLNGNKLKTLPEEIGKLDMMEELVLSENNLEELPRTISMMTNLRILKLQNNKLRNLPYEIAEILTLEILDCTNNAAMNMVPEAWRGDIQSILFTCKIHREYQQKMEEMAITNADLGKHTQYLEQEQLIMKEAISDYKFSIEELKRSLPPKIAAKMEKEAAKNLLRKQGASDKKEDSCCNIM